MKTDLNLAKKKEVMANWALPLLRHASVSRYKIQNSSQMRGITRSSAHWSRTIYKSTIHLQLFFFPPRKKEKKNGFINAFLLLTLGIYSLFRSLSKPMQNIPILPCVLYPENPNFESLLQLLLPSFMWTDYLTNLVSCSVSVTANINTLNCFILLMADKGRWATRLS